MGSHMHTRAASMKVARGFHESAHIDAAVRVIGCVCDTDGSWSLSFDEVHLELVSKSKIGFLETILTKLLLILLIPIMMVRSVVKKLVLLLKLISTVIQVKILTAF